jgi:imidazolonepropionase
MPVLLPGCSHYLGIPFGEARKIIESDLPLALASDYNPGSSPNYDLFQIFSLACIKMKMLPNEVINALTINAAYAMNISDTHGRIRKGVMTPLILTKKIHSLTYLPYAFGERHVEKMINI